MFRMLLDLYYRRPESSVCFQNGKKKNVLNKPLKVFPNILKTILKQHCVESIKFSRIHTKYGEIRSISPNAGKYGPEKLQCGHFPRSAKNFQKTQKIPESITDLFEKTLREVT